MNMKDEITVEIPESFREDVRRAVRILKEAGCTEIFLFGSLVEGGSGKGSDVDLAVRGCPPRKFFHLLGRLLIELDHLVDLVDLDSEDAFARYLEEELEMVQIG
jgi:predicted nucleotidyltransferase